MSHIYALLSIVYMMSFVLVFDRVRTAKGHARFFKNGLLSGQDLDRLRSILSACQED